MSPPAYSVTGTVGSVTGADFHASADDIYVFRQEQDCVIHYEVIQYSNTHRKKAWPPLPSTASGLHITVGHSVHGTSIFSYQTTGSPWVYLQQTYQFSGTGGGTTSGTIMGFTQERGSQLIPPTDMLLYMTTSFSLIRIIKSLMAGMAASLLN